MSAESTIEISDAAWEALTGAYDLQVHVAPDVIERRIDDIDLATKLLLSLIIGSPTKEAGRGIAPLTGAARRLWVKGAVALFLDGTRSAASICRSAL